MNTLVLDTDYGVLYSAETPSFGVSLCNPWEGVSQFLWATDAPSLLAFLQHSTIVLVDVQHVSTARQSPHTSSASKSLVKLGQRSVEGSVMLLDFSCLCARAIVLPLLLPSVHTIQLLQEQRKHQSSAVIVCRAQPLQHVEKLLAAAVSTPAVLWNGDGGGMARETAFSCSGNEKLCEAADYIKEYNYPTLWKQLAHAALYLGENSVAEGALTK